MKQENKLFDILILQEIFAVRFGCFVRAKHLLYLISELEKLGYIYYTNPNGILPYCGQNGGVIIFSLHPLYTNSIQIEKFTHRDEWMLRKGFAIATVRININISNNDEKKYYDLCLGTCHCSPYRIGVILAQIEQFKNAMLNQLQLQKQKQRSNEDDDSSLDLIIGGDFNTRNQQLKNGLIEKFGQLDMQSVWNMKLADDDIDSNNVGTGNMNTVTYRKPALSSKAIYKSMCCCDLIKLPSLNDVKFDRGHCLDHILTNIDSSRIKKIQVVDTRFGDVFVSDHMGVLMELVLP